MLDDGKKYQIRPAQAPVENGVLKARTSVSKLGGMTLTIGLSGFKGTIGADYSVRSADASDASVLKGMAAKMYIDPATGKFRTKRITFSGFSMKDSDDGVTRVDGLIPKKSGEETPFYAEAPIRSEVGQ